MPPPAVPRSFIGTLLGVSFTLLTASGASAEPVHEFYNLTVPAKENGDSPFELDNRTTGDEYPVYRQSFAPDVKPYKRTAVYTRFDGKRLHASQAPFFSLPYSASDSRRIKRKLFIRESGKENSRVILPSSHPRMHIVSGTCVGKQFTLQKNSDDLYALYFYENGLYQCTFDIEEDDDAYRDSPSSYIPAVKHAPFGENLIRSYGDKKLDALITKCDLPEIVAYFQSFDVGELGEGSDNLKRVLTEKKGVCRHRAFAMFVIASACSYEIRVVSNEAHVFVEIKDVNEIWHLVDLGGGYLGFRYEKSFKGDTSDTDTESVDDNNVADTVVNAREVSDPPLHAVLRKMEIWPFYRIRTEKRWLSASVVNYGIDFLVPGGRYHLCLNDKTLATFRADARGEAIGEISVGEDLPPGKYVLRVSSKLCP